MSGTTRKKRREAEREGRKETKGKKGVFKYCIHCK